MEHVIEELLILANTMSGADRDYHEALSINVGVREAEEAANNADQQFEKRLRQVIEGYEAQLESIGAGGVERLRSGAPSLGVIYEAWHEVGADCAGLEWNKFATAIMSAQSAQAKPDERAAFEAWIKQDAGDLSTFGQGQNMHYANSAVNNSWTGWKARASLALLTPKAATCKSCCGSQETLGHADDCIDDLCALNGDEHSCSGQITLCPECAPRAQPAAVLVAHRILRRRPDGEWVNDGRYWSDGAPSADLATSIPSLGDGWRIDYAYASPAPAPNTLDAETVKKARRYDWLRDFHNGPEGVQDNLPYISAGADNDLVWALIGPDADVGIDAAIAAQSAQGAKP